MSTNSEVDKKIKNYLARARWALEDGQYLNNTGNIIEVAKMLQQEDHYLNTVKDLGL